MVRVGHLKYYLAPTVDDDDEKEVTAHNNFVIPLPFLTPTKARFEKRLKNGNHFQILYMVSLSLMTS